MDRRALLSAIGAAASATAGCLRLTAGKNTAPTDSPATGSPHAVDRATTRTESLAAETPSSAATESPVRLAKLWNAPGDTAAIWAGDDELFLNWLDSIAAVSIAGETRWETRAVERTYYLAQAGTVGKSTVYAGIAGGGETENAGRVRAYDRSDGSERWTFTATGDGPRRQIGAVSLVSEDLLVAGINGDTDGPGSAAYGIDAASGERRWTLDAGAELVTDAFGFDGRAYVGTTGGLFACDPETGAVDARAEDAEVGSTGSVRDGDALYAAWNSVTAFDLRRRESLWEADLLEMARTKPILAEGTLYVGTRAGHVYALGAETGTERWRTRVNADVRSLATSRGHLWVGDDAGYVYAFSKADGATALELEPEMRIRRRVVVLDDVLVVGGATTRAYRIGQ